MDIQVEVPIKFSLTVLEFDEHVPSIKGSMALEISGFKYNILLTTTAWIECVVFDRFVSCMKEGVTAALNGLGEDFSLTVDGAGEIISWNILENDLDGREVLLKGSRAISKDEVARLINSFEAYPKWW